jgi:hypothetical protein
MIAIIVKLLITDLVLMPALWIIAKLFDEDSLIGNLFVVGAAILFLLFCIGVIVLVWISI